MSSAAFVQLALKTLACSQKELAARLGVSPTQISKWKKGEHMSFDMEDKLRAISGIGEHDPLFILWAGSLEAAAQWQKLIDYLAELANEGGETGYNTYPLTNPEGLLYWNTVYVLQEMGVQTPIQFSKNLESIVADNDDYEEIFLAIESNPYAYMIYEIYKSMTDVYGFYYAYIDDLFHDDELDLIGTEADNIEPCLLELAASKINPDLQLAPRFREFQQRVTSDYRKWLDLVKERAFRAGTPLKAELLDLVYSSHDALGHEAEAESLGFNSTRLHPDIYMNELLVGMRIIHQVLPAIMKKLDIEKDFTLDETDLRLR